MASISLGRKRGYLSKACGFTDSVFLDGMVNNLFLAKFSGGEAEMDFMTFTLANVFSNF